MQTLSSPRAGCFRIGNVCSGGKLRQATALPKLDRVPLTKINDSSGRADRRVVACRAVAKEEGGES
jgi:hypothetical protein